MFTILIGCNTQTRVVCFDRLLPIFQRWYFSLLLASSLSKIDRSVEEWSRDEAFTYFFFTPPVLLCIPQSTLRGQEWRWESCNPECLPKALEHYSFVRISSSFRFFHILCVSSCSDDYDENHQLDYGPSSLVYSRIIYASREEWKAIDTQYQEYGAEKHRPLHYATFHAMNV